MLKIIKVFRALALTAAGAITLSAAAYAAAADYAFEPVSAEIKSGKGSEVAVRLVNKTTGEPVSGAVLFRTQLDMSPDGMGSMLAEHKAMPTEEPGIYKFNADLSMAGGWALKIMAKVPGEADTVQGTVVFQAK